MSEVNFERMLEICNRFVDTNPIDFYQLFQIDRNMNLMEINKDIKNKRIRVMFHPDQIGVIPDEYKATFEKICNSIPDLVNVFSTRENRDKYDASLVKANSMESDETIMDKPEVKAEDRQNFENAIIVTASKYGWKHIVNALSKVINKGQFNGFTRDNSARDIVEQIGPDVIKEIVLESSYTDVDDYFRMNMEQVIANYISDLFKNNQIMARRVDALKNAIDQTMYKYNHNQVYSAMTKYAQTGNADSVTSTNNARRDLTYFVKPDDVQEMLIFINNQDRREDTPSYYINAKDQNLNYQLGLYMMNLERKNRQTYEQQSSNKY